MCGISTRIDTLNRQLMIISKLQEMEEESNLQYQSTCKKYSMHNNVGKYCHCAHYTLPLQEQCNRFNCIEECFSYDDSRKGIVCNVKTCKARKKLHYYKNTQLRKVQTDLKNTVQASKSTSINTDINTQKSIRIEKEQNTSDQVNFSSKLSKIYASDKIINTYEEKGEQTIPTKDNFYTELSVNTSNMNNVQVVTSVDEEKVQTEIDKNVAQETNESKVDYNIDIPVKYKKMFERIQKDLVNERKRTEELEKKLKSLTCSLNCLKEDSEQRAICLKGALNTAEEQTKLAMDLVKQSKNQADMVKANRDELLKEITKLQQQIIEVAHANTALAQERDNLKNKLESLSEDESKRCEEVEKEVNRMRCALKEKENALNKERTEFMDMILELTNVIKVQKKRICEMNSICSNQQNVLHMKDKELSQKNTELSEVQSMLQLSDCTCREMEEKIEHLKHCLCEETKTCECLKQELEMLKENHSSELRIQEKIVEEQNRTIAKQRKLLHDSEKMAQQAASEFEQLKEELHQEKQRNKSLQITLDKTNNELNKIYSLECEKCRSLRNEIDHVKKEKQRALTIAKFAYQKFHESIKDYQNELIYERQQHKYMALIIEKKEKEIGCLKNQICQNSSRTIKKMSDYVMHVK